MQENEKYLQQLFFPKTSSPDEIKRNHEKQSKVSRNNCGIHTIFDIMGNCTSGIKLYMSPSQIDTHSIRIRAWLIKMIVEGLPEGTSWAESFKVHIRRNMEVDKWFQRENFVEFRNSSILEAILTLFPDQYIAGDAIVLAIKSLNLSLGPDSYLTDV